MLASLHPGTMFVKMSVLDSPFLVEKLGVKVLPELVVFGRRAEVKDRITGFEDLGNSDGFTTKTLEWRLAQGGELLIVVTLFSSPLTFGHLDCTGAVMISDGATSRPIVGFAQSSTASKADDDDDLDWE